MAFISGESGSFELTGKKGFTVKVGWSETYDVATNTSVVSIDSLQVKSSDYTAEYWMNGPIKVNDAAVITFNASMGTHVANVRYRNTYYAVRGSGSPAPWPSGAIVHNSDGTKSVVIELDIGGYTTDGQNGHGWTVKGSKTITLTTIPRKSAIDSAAEVTLGRACSVKWTPLSTGFQYKLKFSLGDWSHTTEDIQPSNTSAYTYTGYTVPMEVANQLPNTTSGEMTVTLYTYNGGTSIGEASATFAVTVPENADTRPTVTDLVLTAVDSPFAGVFVQGNSKVQAAFTGEGKYGAEITSGRMTVEGKDYTGEYISDHISSYGDIKVTIAVTDTRGFTGYAEGTIHVCAYSKPQVKVSVCQRCDADGNADDGGTYLVIEASRSYSKVDQHNSCILRYRYAKHGQTLPETWTTLLEANASGDAVQTGALLGSLATDAIYIVEVGVIDTVGNTSETSYTILTEAVFMHERIGGKGLGLGMYCTADNRLEVAWDSYFHGEVMVDGVTLKEYILAVISEGG